MALLRSTSGALVFYAFAHLQAAGARHAVATRLGGVSTGQFAALNVGLSVGDDPALVAANRRALFAAVDATAENVVTCHQVHGVTVAYVGTEQRGCGALDPSGSIAQTDALITDRRAVFLFLRFADCVPVLFCDPVRWAVGLAHAGWKGTVGNIVGATVAAMARICGSEPRNILAAIGPAIGPCHYIVQEDVASQVRSHLPFYSDVLNSCEDGYFLDLPEANRRHLLASGLSEANLAVAGRCTACCTDEFYSHRAEKGKTGRFGVIIGWEGDGYRRA